MGGALKNEVEQAIKLLKDNGYRISAYGKEGLFVIRTHKLGHKSTVRYQIRQRKSTIRDRATAWPEGTEIAEIDESKLKWEPINSSAKEVAKISTSTNTESFKFLKESKEMFFTHIQSKYGCSSVSREMDIATDAYNFIVQKLQNIS